MVSTMSTMSSMYLASNVLYHKLNVENPSYHVSEETEAHIVDLSIPRSGFKPRIVEAIATFAAQRRTKTNIGQKDYSKEPGYQSIRPSVRQRFSLLRGYKEARTDLQDTGVTSRHRAWTFAGKRSRQPQVGQSHDGMRPQIR